MEWFKTDRFTTGDHLKVTVEEHDGRHEILGSFAGALRLEPGFGWVGEFRQSPYVSREILLAEIVSVEYGE